MMPSHVFPLVLLMGLVAAPLASTASEAPNVVVILADDLGWNAVGYHNETFVTPNIDRLVADGMELDRFYVAPMCSPTRAGLMTGRYPIRFGAARAVIPPYRDFGLPKQETTLGEALAARGYPHRGVFGKWHLGHRRAKWHPLMQGFTHFHGHYNGAIDYFDLTREGERDWHVNFEPSDQAGYATDLIATAAANWIREVAVSDAPYFCYVPFNAPHSPFQAPEEAIARFRHLDHSLASDAAPSPKPTSTPSVRAIYAAMIWKMDQGIGQILEAIEQSGEADNTLVWFFSDNGGVGNIPANNDPLRGSKLTVYEGGIRVPAAVRWPQRIKPGSVCNQVCGYIDILPTVIAACGGEAASLCDQPLDGIDLSAVLTDTDPEATIALLEQRPWFSYHGQTGEQTEHLAVTVDGWKLKVNGPRLRTLTQLTDGTNQVELFHLAEDLRESHDLQAQHPEKVRQLGEMLVTHRALQPSAAVPPYRAGSKRFEPPPRWELNPADPEQRIGKHK